MDPERISELVSIAYCLEAIADKKDCTTRYVDLPGRPLDAFVKAGIVSGKYFGKLAREIKANQDPDVFGYFVPALKDSRGNGTKTVNFGLLEIMFPTVYARMTSAEDDVLDNLVKLMRKENHRDIMNLVEARQEGWKTSDKNKINFIGKEYANAKSPYDCYMIFMQNNDPDNTGHQWSKEFFNGLPILRSFFRNFRETDKPLLEQVRISYDSIRRKYPTIRVGIISDMCAAAIFLHLSYGR